MTVKPEGVDGWLTEAQAELLAGVGATCPPDGKIVEIGSYRGLSTIVLARAAPEGAAIVAIDPHAGTDRGPGEIEGYDDEAARDRELFEHNLVAAGVRHRVRHVAAFSADAHSAVHGDIDVLYIDGAHRHALARADIRGWGARVGDGGTMLIHDAFSSVGVTLAIVLELLFGNRFRYVERSRTLVRYEALAGPLRWDGRLRNAARQAAQLGFFAHNVVVKLLLSAGIGKLLRRLGRRVPQWPY